MASAVNSGSIADSVHCNPLIHIHESQNPNASTSTFSNGDPMANTQMADTQYANNTPGLLFNLHNINNIDMSTHNALFMSSQLPSNGVLPSSSLQDFTPASFAFHDGNAMDLSEGDRIADQSSPATLSSQSRGGSISQSSYSPSQQNEHHLPYRASPKTVNMVETPGNATVFPGFANSEAFAANTFGSTNDMDTDAFNDGFLLRNEWEQSALNTGTGMTPMADASWDAMLESVTMGWDSVGPSRNNVPGAR